MAKKAPTAVLSPCDVLIYGASGILPGQAGKGPFALAIGAGKVLEGGPERELRTRWKAREERDAKGGLLSAGFVDAHTHPAFLTGRAAEFSLKCAGKSYPEIAAAGGGILSSVAAVRKASPAALAVAVERNFRRMLRHGTTTCEAKSGYGLSVAEELKSLRAIRTAAKATGMEALPTFLGAHAVPEEFQGRADAYVDLLCQEALPAVKEEGLARAADVYVEEGAFSVRQARRYLERARELGFALRVHADQFHALGGVELAVELGAESVDHLEVLSDAGLEALALSRKTYAGLLPAVPHFCGQKADAPARKLIKAGVPWYLATDFNPGSSYTPSLPEAAHFARRRLGLTAAEAFAGVTSHAAASLGLAGRKGTLDPGADADVLILDLPDLEHFGYAFGENPVVEGLRHP